MFIVSSYTLAVIFCFITMLCWGSWANTQKIAAKSWRFELFLLGLCAWHSPVFVAFWINFRQLGR